MKPRVLVAMSGGVDSPSRRRFCASRIMTSSASRCVLRRSHPHQIAKRRGTCCSHDDFEDARRVAERMDFPFYVIDLRADFAARVVDNFVSEYLGGRTPNPCVMCNREIKFDRLWSRARALNADYVATGHYARIEQGADGKFHLLRAVDDTKDQSYFLFTLGQDELVANDFSARRDDQDRSSRTRARVGTRDRGQAREPGNLLRSRRRLRELCRAAERSSATPSRLDCRQRRKAAGRSRRSASIHRRTASRSGYRERRAAVRSRDSRRIGRGRGRTRATNSIRRASSRIESAWSTIRLRPAAKCASR